MTAQERGHRELSMPVWITGGVVILLMAVLLVVGYVYVGSTQARTERRIAAAERQSDQRWCAMFDLLTRQSRASPPTTQDGRAFAEVIENLRRGFNCPDR